MKNLQQIILWIALVLLLSSCTKKDFNFQTLKLPKFNLPELSSYKLDQSLPMVTNIKYRSSSSEVVLEWTPVQSREIDGYRVFRYNNLDKKYELVGSKSDRTSSHFVDNKLLPNRLYQYRISSFTKDGRVSNATPPITTQTKQNIPAVSGLKAQSDLPNKIKLSWDIYSHNSAIQRYIIQRSEKQPQWDNIGSADDSLSVEYFDYRVISGKTYFYRVIAMAHNSINAPASIPVSAHSKSLPLAITNIMATDNVPRKIKLTWQDPNLKKNDRQIARYNIYTSVYQDTLYTLHAYTTQKFYIDKVGIDNKKIYYKITAVDSDGLESLKQKKPAVGSTKNHSKQPMINSIKTQDGKNILTWTRGSKNITQYYVIKKYWDGIIYKKLKITGITSTTFVDNKIKLGKTYKYTVVGIDSDGIESKPSREVGTIVE